MMIITGSIIKRPTSCVYKCNKHNCCKCIQRPRFSVKSKPKTHNFLFFFVHTSRIIYVHIYCKKCSSDHDMPFTCIFMAFRRTSVDVSCYWRYFTNLYCPSNLYLTWMNGLQSIRQFELNYYVTKMSNFYNILSQNSSNATRMLDISLTKIDQFIRIVSC